MKAGSAARRLQVCGVSGNFDIFIAISDFFANNSSPLRKGRCPMSFTTIQDFFAEVVGIKVSTGFLAKQVRKTSVALKGTYDDLVAQLRKEKHLHLDETGSKENGKRRWTWCLRAKSFTVFHIGPTGSPPRQTRLRNPNRHPLPAKVAPPQTNVR